MNEQDLLKLKKRIDEAKSKLSELKGRQDYLMQQLKKDWECGSVEEAEEKLKEMKIEIGSLNSKIAEGVRKVETRMQKEGL